MSVDATSNTIARATWHPRIARAQAPLDEYALNLVQEAGPGHVLVLARSHDAVVRLRRMLPAPNHVMTIAEAFGLLSPHAIDTSDLLSPLVSHWAILDALPPAVRGPMRPHLARELARSISLLESHGFAPPYPEEVSARLDPVLAEAHATLVGRREEQHALGRYAADERVLSLARSAPDGEAVQARMKSRFPSVQAILLADVAWMSPAEKVALDRVSQAVEAIHFTMVARPGSSTDDEWAALAHTDALRNHLAARGALEDVGGDETRGGALIALASPLPMDPPPLADVHVTMPADPAAETFEIAARAADLVHAGTPPHHIAIVAPDLESYAARLRDGLERHGLPVSLRHHGHTAHTPAGSLLAILILDALDKGLERDAVLDWLAHPLCSVFATAPAKHDGKPIRLDAHRLRDLLLARGLRPRGVTGPRGWSQALNTLTDPEEERVRRAIRKGDEMPQVSERDLTTISLARELVGYLESLRTARDALEFIEALRNLLARVRLPQNVLRQASGLAEPDALLAGYRQLIALIDEVERAYVAAPPQSTEEGARVIREALRHALLTLELPLGGDPDYGIQVIGFRNAPGLRASHVFVVGATDRALPTRGASARTARRLRAQLGPAIPLTRIDEDQEARWILHRILADTRASVLFSVPQREGDEPLGPSVLLDELMDGFVLAPPPARPNTIRTRYELHRAIALGLIAAPPGVLHEAQKTVVHVRGSPDIAGPFSGALAPETMTEYDNKAPLVSAMPLSPGRLERFAQCAYRSLIHDGLRVKRPDVRDADFSSLDRGLLLHEILDAYARDGIKRKGAPFRPDPDDDIEAAALYRIGLERFLERKQEAPVWDAFAATLLGGLRVPANAYQHEPPGLLARVLAEMQEMDSGDGVLATELDFGEGDAPQVTLRVADNMVPLQGQIDRIDHRQLAGVGDKPGLRVIDYKSGNAPDITKTLGGIGLQLPLYLHATRTLFPEHVPTEAAYYALTSPRKDDYGIVNGRTRKSLIVRGDDPDRFDRLIEEETPKNIDQMLRSERAGRFPITWLDPQDAGCSYCDVQRICGMDTDLQTDRQLATRKLPDNKPETTGYVPRLARADPLESSEDDT